jgi:hypothetical protein
MTTQGDQSWLLNQLLKRWERSSQYGRIQLKQPIRLRITPRTFPAYFDEADPEPRAQLHTAARLLAEAGIVRLKWGRRPHDHELAAIDLDPAGVERAYQLAHRPNPEHGRARLLELLDEVIGKSLLSPTWYQAFLENLRDRLSRVDVMRGPFDPRKVRNGLDLIRAMDAVVHLETPERPRSLSIRLFSDSKRLESLQRRLASILRKHDPNLPPNLKRADDVLREYGVVRKPGLLLIQGDIGFECAGKQLETGSWQPCIGIPQELVTQGRIMAIRARAVLTIENEETFHATCEVARAAGLLLIYGGGFSTRMRVRFLQLVREFTSGKTPFFHWGDLDWGGLAILLHLRRTLNAVIQPLCASPEVIGQFQCDGSALPDRNVELLRKLSLDPLASDIQDVIASLVEHRVRIEQECIDSGYAIAELETHLRRSG